MEVFSQFLKELGPTKIVLSFIGAFTFVVLLVLYLSKVSNQSMVVLYKDLEIEDSNKIIQELDNKNIPYEIVAGGTVIKVPEDKVLRLRMSMAEVGLPSHGSMLGYELFDGGESISTSNFLQNVNLVRALEGELSRTISTFDSIQKARVHLVIPKKDLFSKENQQPRASVILTMKGHNTLKKSEINAIAHLVVTAVPELDLSQITIVDTKGRPLKLGAKDSSGDFNESQSEDFRVSYENRLKSVIEDLLEKTIGIGKVQSYVSAEINFDRIVTNSEIFDPDGRVARSVQTIEERENNKSGEPQDPSVANNIPEMIDDSQGAIGGDSSSSERIDETTNFEISKTVRNHISETGNVKRISVAVMVDGVYQINKETGEVTYIPRSSEEIEKYTALVKSAIGFKEDRGDKIELINMQFVTDLESLREETLVEWLKSELPSILQTMVIGIVILLVLVLVVRPIAIRAFEVSKNDVEVIHKKDHLTIIADSVRSNITEKSAMDSLNEAISEKEEGIMDIKASPKVRKINDIVVRNPNATLSLLRKWMNEGS